MVWKERLVKKNINLCHPNHPLILPFLMVMSAVSDGPRLRGLSQGVIVKRKVEREKPGKPLVVSFSWAQEEAQLAKTSPSKADSFPWITLRNINCKVDAGKILLCYRPSVKEVWRIITAPDCNLPCFSPTCTSAALPWPNWAYLLRPT